jgi:pyruvate dehydrogenase complex dehydrogenase (E1) component
MRARADGPDLHWSDTDRRAVDLLRVLAMDAVEHAGASVGLEHFGASADYKTLYAEFGITAERAAQAAHASITTVTAAGGHT